MKAFQVFNYVLYKGYEFQHDFFWIRNIKSNGEILSEFQRSIQLVLLKSNRPQCFMSTLLRTFDGVNDAKTFIHSYSIISKSINHSKASGASCNYFKILRIKTTIVEQGESRYEHCNVVQPSIFIRQYVRSSIQLINCFMLSGFQNAPTFESC